MFGNTVKQQIKQYNVDAAMRILLENILKPGSSKQYYTTIGTEEEKILLFALAYTFPYAKTRIAEWKKYGVTTTTSSYDSTDSRSFSRQGKDRHNGNREPTKQQNISRFTTIKNTLLTFAIIILTAFLVFLGYVWLRQEGIL